MRYINLLPLAATLATAVVIPDDATAQQLSLDIERLAEEAGEAARGWWDTLRETTQHQVNEIKESVDAAIQDRWDALSSTPQETVDFVLKRAQTYLDSITNINHPDPFQGADDHGDNEGSGKPDNGHVGRPGHHGTTNLTAYQAIQTSNYTKKFAALVNDFPDIVQLLNSTDANVTAFVPIDKAIEKFHERHGNPPKHIIQRIIEYHIVPGYFTAGHVVASHTLPTALTSEALGGRPQRLRVSFNIFGLRINFYSRVNVANLFVKNGVIHGLDSVLVPPPTVRRHISLFPSEYSTLELAAEKTGLLPHHDDKHSGKEGDKDHAHHLTGLTLFAPTNSAFRLLGHAANAFLFNTEKGLRYLRALLKYHIVANHTLYSDAYYGVEGNSEDLFPLRTPDDLLPLVPDDESESGGRGSGRNGHFHIDLPTLLDDKSLSIDIARWYAFINIRINGYQNVAVEDDVAWDGVVQSMHSVIIPPRKGNREGEWTEADGDISVEELIERLEPYLDDDVQSGRKTNAEDGVDQAWGEL